ncbi:MAG: hypothetical protein CVV30_04140 [Methanomicrobiales archaeon HGW-Methanomicrobiales-1]|nr:MAG: hypothetical protein CVV30_04140 [Methanomicrobiales archaeon HGW-Methanomicrobiales-1]
MRSEILNPNCTGLAGRPHRKTFRFLIRIQNKIFSKELAGKTSELAGRVPEMMQSGGNLSPDEGFMGAALVMG